MRLRIILVAVLMAAFSLLPAVGAGADSGSASYVYHVGDAFLAAFNPAFSPDVARADNGDTIALKGTGTLSIHPGSVTGGGTFVHRHANGTVVAQGTWTATNLL